MQIADFVESYINKENIKISSLVDDYLEINPSAHALSNKSFYCEAGVEYFLHRLSREILDIKSLVLTADTDKLKEYEENSNYKSISCQKRKRSYYYNKKSHELIVGINSITDIHDLVTILTGLLVETQKLSERKNLNPKQFSDSHISFIRSLFPKISINSFFTKLKEISNFSIRFLNCNEKSYQERADKWGDFLSEKLDSIDFDQNEHNFYIVMSNSHSMINPQTPYIRLHESEILDWGKHQSKFYNIYKGLNDNTYWKDDCLYYIYRNYTSQHPEIRKEAREMNKNYGIYEFADPQFNGPSFQCVDLRRIDVEHNDNRIFDSAIGSKDKTKNYIINIDFTMGGYQAKYVLQNILKRINNVKGIYVFGKAGSLEGNVGDIIIPDFNYNPYNKKLTFFKNDLKAKYIRRYLRRYKIYESQGMLTVLGVLLQNDKHLKYHYAQNFTGVEMECGPYLEAIMNLSKDSIHDSSTLMLKNDFDFGLAYYISDTPYHQGKTLGTLGFSGVESVYAISVSLLNRILIRAYSKEIKV